MNKYSYCCAELKKFDYFSIKELGIDISLPLPRSFVKDGKTWVKVLETISIYENEQTSEEIQVNSLEYYSQIGSYPEKEIFIDNKKYLWKRCIGGIPSFADLSDTLRRNHDTGYKTKFTKPPLEADKNFGYGLT
ncbi:MAG: hypothetical protein ACRCZB_05145 [Bacteroidales bacterium]